MEQSHFGIANIAVTGDTERGLTFVTEAQTLLRQTLEQMRVRKITQFSMQKRFADDTYCYVVCAAGYNMVRIVCGNEADQNTTTQQVRFPVDVPDFVSGAITNGVIVTVPAQPGVPSFQTLSQFHPTQQCSTFMALPFNFQNINRLTVTPFTDIDNGLSGSNFQGQYSQYRFLKPSMYSGMMRKVVQTLMGFGKQRTDGAKDISIYDQTKPFITSKNKASLPTKYQKDVQKNGLQIRYDWRFARTHGVTTAGDNRKWLVEISITQGVIAYPLPLNANTTTVDFRNKLEAMGDIDGQALVDTFGGFPTGDTMPAAAQLPAWVRAGQALQLCSAADMGVFYKNVSSYGSSMGWAFNLRGDEAHNTGYYYDESNVMHGVHYMVPIAIGTSAAIESNPDAPKLRAGYEKLRGSNADIVDAAQWKLDRLDKFDFQMATELFNLKNNGPAQSLAYVDALVLTPLASNSGHLSKVMDGYLYNPNKIGNLIKFPEPEISLLLSQDMRPTDAVAKAIASSKRCDTTMHVFFVDDEMKWVKYYREPDGSGVAGSHTDDFEDCMFVGSWESHDDFGVVAIGPSLYTNDFDDRAEYPAGSSDTAIKGLDMGYAVVAAGDDIQEPYHGVATRGKRFLKTTTTNTINGEQIQTGVIVPFYDREAYYYAKMHSDTGTTKSVVQNYVMLQDPYVCDYWRNFPGYMGRWAGDGGATFPHVLLSGVQHPNGCGPVTARTVWDNGSGAPIYVPSECGDYADSGPWCFVCDNIDSMLYSLPEPTLPPASIVSNPAKAQVAVNLVSASGFGPVQTFASDPATSFGLWPLHSPLTDPAISADQYMEETCNAMGEATVMRYSSNINSGVVVRGAPNYPGIETGTLTFIGVLNG